MDTRRSARLALCCVLLWGLLSAADLSAATISGKVVAVKDGAPLSHIAIKIFNKRWSWLYRVYTDDAGKYTTQELPGGRYYLVTENDAGYIDLAYPGQPVTAAEWPPERAQLIALQGGSDLSGINFALRQGAKVTGRVVDAEKGRPIANVAVRVENLAGHTIAAKLTDSTGRFSMKGLLFGQYRARTLNKAGYIDGYYHLAGGASPSDLLTLSETSPAARLDFRLAKGGVISGRLIGSHDGQPIAFDHVHLYDQHWKLFQIAKTDAAGHYQAIGLPSGRYFMRTMTVQNYIDQYHGHPTEKRKAIPLVVAQPHHTPSIDFALQPGGTISGRITRSSDGRSLRDVYVNLFDQQWNHVTGSGLDWQGRYAIRKLPPGRYYLQTSNAQGFQDEYHAEAIDREAAIPIVIAPGTTLEHIDFSLSKAP
ncbi:MAG: carboxypeptidase-like regulatory domain-containing protein [Desulfosarcinaceae bacterium]|nr:carboxypeptidase-like regulatory domain-containing protein [Desulfosarcinaceae bacterium]